MPCAIAICWMNTKGRPQKTDYVSGVLPNPQLNTIPLTKPQSALGAVGRGFQVEAPCAVLWRRTSPRQSPSRGLGGAFQTLRAIAFKTKGWHLNWEIPGWRDHFRWRDPWGNSTEEGQCRVIAMEEVGQHRVTIRLRVGRTRTTEGPYGTGCHWMDGRLGTGVVIERKCLEEPPSHLFS